MAWLQPLLAAAGLLGVAVFVPLTIRYVRQCRSYLEMVALLEKNKAIDASDSCERGQDRKIKALEDRLTYLESELFNRVGRIESLLRGQ